MIEKCSAPQSAVVLMFPTMAKKIGEAEFPNRLRELRTARKLTLKQVEELTGIAFTNIGKIETGERDLKSWHMAKFAEIYGVDQADLFNPKDGGLTSVEREAVQTYRELSPEVRKSFEAFVQGLQPLRASIKDGAEVVSIARDKDERRSA